MRAFARELADTVAREEPGRLTTEHRKERRGQRIFLDINRNADGQTMTAPYSLRAHAGAPAATPLDLSEVSRATSRRYGLANLLRRMVRKPDPWVDLSR